MKGTFYSVGVGPGDPELVTVKAVNTVRKSDVIFFADSGAKENLAYKIIADYVRDKEVVYVDMPMTRDKAELSAAHERAACMARSCLDKGLSVSFVTIGDPSVYSTAMYIHKRLDGYNTEMVPGVPSFCAAAASLNVSLCEGNEPLFILPASYAETEELLNLRGNKVLMKSGKKLKSVLEKIRDNNIMMVENASMSDEKIYKTVDEINETSGYFSLVVVKER